MAETATPEAADEADGPAGRVSRPTALAALMIQLHHPDTSSFPRRRPSAPHALMMPARATQSKHKFAPDPPSALIHPDTISGSSATGILIRAIAAFFMAFRKFSM
jgi:hypothetical protein